MTNEELAARIQAGERDLIPELWEQVRRFVWQQARRRFVLTNGYGGMDVEDLAQSGFLALLEAVEDFQPKREYQFLTFLTYHLKNAFAAAGGYKSRKRDPLSFSVSLNTPLGDDPDGDTFEDLQPDPVDQIEGAERKIWLEQLSSALERALSDLSTEERDTLQRRYLKNQTLQEVSVETGTDAATVRKMEQSALAQLRRNKHRNGLEQFVEDRTPYYTRVGISAFNSTHTSAVEKAVLERERLEESYRSPRSAER